MSESNHQLWPDAYVALVPVYNHGKTVATVVTDLIALGADVIVVNDGSSDDSAEAARSTKATVIDHEHNSGKAQALITGIEYAFAQGYSHVVTVDADGQHPIDEVPKLIDASFDNPQAIIVGSRDMSVAPKANQFGRWLSTYGVRIACGVWTGDSQSGLRIYPVASTLSLPVAASRYAYEIEVLVRAGWAKIPVHDVQVKVIYPEDRVTHFNKIKDNTITCMTNVELILRRFLPFRQIRRKRYLNR